MLIGHGCAVVQRSAYPWLAGVPVALLGPFGYVACMVALAVLCSIRLVRDSPPHRHA